MASSSKVILEEFAISGYRSLKNISFRPNKDLSVLVGPNGSGKTNILAAIQLLKAATSYPYPSRGSEEGTTSCQIHASFKYAKKKILFRSTVVLRIGERNEEQILRSHEEWSFENPSKDRVWQEIPRMLIDPRFQRVLWTRERGGTGASKNTPAMLNQFLGSANRRALEAIFEFEAAIKYYSASQFTNPARCPTSFEIDEGNKFVEPYSDRGPHLSFMTGLFESYRSDKTSYAAYMEIVGPNGVNLIDDIQWRQFDLSSNTVDVKVGGKVVKRRKKRVLILPTISIKNSKLSFNQLSEGTFRTLALLFYLMTDKSSLLFIEEPEVCVHHGLLHSLVEAIKAHSQHKQIVISTHSELVLDSVKAENIFSVKLQATKGTRIKPLTTSISNKELQALRNYLQMSGNLGGYLNSGGVV
jgi:predicted ATPase